MPGKKLVEHFSLLNVSVILAEGSLLFLLIEHSRVIKITGQGR